MRPDRCETCRFWWCRYDPPGVDESAQLETTDEPWGFCRRYPPDAGNYPESFDSFELPVVAKSDWCGEWRAAEPEKASPGEPVDLPLVKTRYPFAAEGLSVKAQNVLERYGVRSVADLAALTERDVMQFKHCGVVMLGEFKDLLASHGLSFRGSMPDADTPSV